MKWSVPGSLLLAGAYRITEEGGLGIAIAMERRATLDVFETPNFSVVSRWIGREEHWQPHMMQSTSIADIIYRRLSPGIQLCGKALIDTRKFYNAAGQKWGIGSSAAATLLLTHFMTPSCTSKEMLIRKSIENHRAFQGGHGSGYDVCTSGHGGMGLFRGGLQPEWEELHIPSWINGYLIHSPTPISSSNAIIRFQHWTQEKPKEAASWRKCSDSLVMELLHQLSLNSADCSPTITAIAQLAESLGRNIGVPARPRLPDGMGNDIRTGTRKGVSVHCVGAGDELSILLYHDDALTPSEITILEHERQTMHIIPLKIAYSGLRREKT